MAVLTKASLAKELGISKARVSQYVKRGLPVRSDGKVDRDEALNWISSNHAPRGLSPAQGVKRAGAMAEKSRGLTAGSTNATGPADDAMIAASAEMVGWCGAVAAEAAMQLGLPVSVAWKLDTLVAAALAEKAEQFLDSAGVYRREDAFELAVDPLWALRQTDWEAAAKDKGEAVDEDRWALELDEIER